MKSKVLPIIIVIVIVLAAGIGYFVYSTSPYTGYSAAFTKSNKINSTEYDTSIKATIDGETTTSTGNMKIRDIATNVNFVNEMTIDGQKITQFCDGEYIYIDNGEQKTKFKIGEKPESNQKERGANGDFNMDYYIQEFSMLLDASKIKDLKIAEKFSQNIVEKISKKNVSGGTEYDVTLAPQLVDEVFATVIDEQLGEENSPKCTLKSFTYKAAANKDKFITSITYKIEMDVIFPSSLTGEAEDSEKSVQLEVRLDYTSPGKEAEFSLPDTNGY